MAQNRRSAPPDATGESSLLQFEREAFASGFLRVAGVDEAGRGPLAGPVVAAAVVFPRDVPLPAVFDSKQLTPRQRDELASELDQLPGICFGIAFVNAADIDRLNILRATHQAMRQALGQLAPAADFALVDGLPVPGLPVPNRAIVKGDARSASIAAASILAKVHRDRYMDELETRYPGYAFSRHKGYGTAIHLAALNRLGPCPEHRLSFAPVATAAGLRPRQPEFDLG